MRKLTKAELEQLHKLMEKQKKLEKEEKQFWSDVEENFDDVLEHLLEKDREHFIAFLRKKNITIQSHQAMTQPQNFNNQNFNNQNHF